MKVFLPQGGFIKKKRILWWVSQYYLSLLSRNMKGIFSDINCVELIDLQKIKYKNVRDPYHWVLLEIFTLRVVCNDSPTIHQLQFSFPTPILVHIKIVTQGLCCNKMWFSVSVCLSNFEGHGLPCDLTFLKV